MQRDFPILEFDSSRRAVIEPHQVLQSIDVPEACVLCFFQEVITGACGNDAAVCIHHLGSEVGDNPIYDLNIDGRRVAVVHPGVGAPLAAASL